MIARRLAALALAAAVLAVLGVAAAPAGAAKRKAPKLQAFNSCSSLVTYARRNARRVGGGSGVPSRATPLISPGLPGPIFTGRERTGQPMPAASAPASGEDQSSGGAGSGGGAEPDFSGTNIQEAGVDEPDIVKTNGRRVYVMAAGVLRVLDMTGAEPRVVGSLPMRGQEHQLLLRGDRLLVMAIVYERDGGLGTVLTEVDVANGAAPAIRRELRLDGFMVDARQVGGAARVVVTAPPQPVAVPELPETNVRNWVPRTVLRSRVTNRTFRRPVVQCDDVRHPRAFSGLDLTTVITVDLDKGLYSVDRDAVMAGAETVYASTESLYVASRRYAFGRENGIAPEGRGVTEIHRFDITKPDATTYRSSGQVEGYVLNQYSLSEHAGDLRVATTEEPDILPVPAGAPVAAAQERQESESFVTVLRENGARLERIGRVGGLGRGERIYAVRFIGDTGYVVTFRQTDPLYTIDLAKPEEPKVLGELKILGFSAYLHPISDTLLLGVGQDATEEGRRRGAQLSLFDVSNLRDPRRVAQASFGEGSNFDAEFDPHAFLWWKPASLTVLPLQKYAWEESSKPFAGVVGYRVGTDALTEAGRFEHPGSDEQRAPIGRSLVIGDKLYTVSIAGLGANRLDSLAPVSFTAFGDAKP